MFGRLGRFVELHDVRTLQFHQYFDLSPHNFLILDGLKRNGLDCKQLVLVFFDVASIDCPETTLSQLNWSYHIALNDFAGHCGYQNINKLS